MVEVKTSDLAIGSIFKYANPIEQKELESWLEDQFEGFESTQTHHSMESEMARIELQSNEKVGENDRVMVLYDSDTDLEGIGDCSFVTIRNKNADFGEIKEDVGSFKDDFTELGLEDQFEVFELTINGRVKVEKGKNLSDVLAEDIDSDLREILGSSAEPKRMTLESDIETRSEGWFRLNVDSKSPNNPKFWNFNLLMIFKSLEDIDQQEIENQIEDSVEALGG